MRISQQLPRFNVKEKALFIVAGKQIGKLYVAERGGIRATAVVEELKPRYSDNEGFFTRGGNGRTYGTGAVREPKDTETKRKFLKKLAAEVKTVLAGKKKFDAVYLFAPDYAVTELTEELPREAREKIRFSFKGNFVKFGPQRLLEKTADALVRKKENREPRNEEEVKILQRPRL